MLRFGQHKFLISLFYSILLLSFLAVEANAVGILQIGSKGGAVAEIQTYLYRLKYLKRGPDGVFGRLTAEAVKSFQLEHSIPADGKVGPDTLEALRAAASVNQRVIEYTVAPDETLAGIAERYNSSIAEIMVKNKLKGNEVYAGQKLLIPAGGNNLSQPASRGRSGGVWEVPWTIATQLWENGEDATIIDAATGKSFKARRLYGYYHADVEPVTRQDTNTMLAIYGGKWSWARRAVVVSIRNLFIAASMNGMPHGHKSIAGNGFPGQFCVHFLGSKVHQDGQVDPEHLAMIETAAKADINKLLNPDGAIREETSSIVQTTDNDTRNNDQSQGG
ncbi:MAG: peptidoglycan-binding protein [Bacillota bacterium]